MLAGCFLSGSPAYASPRISSDTKLSTAGYFQLSWHDQSGASFQLQQSRTGDFRDAVTLYRGPDRATVISGLPNGDYFYRVANAEHEWSHTLKVTVEHHTLGKALGFFGLGASMFVVMLTLLIKGAARKED